MAMEQTESYLKLQLLWPRWPGSTFRQKNWGRG